MVRVFNHNEWVWFGSVSFGRLYFDRKEFKQDISSNAFDQLRMSSLSAWQMAYSRVLAAPILAWVGFAIGWLVLGWSTTR